MAIISGPPARPSFNGTGIPGTAKGMLPNIRPMMIPIKIVAIFGVSRRFSIFPNTEDMRLFTANCNKIERDYELPEFLEKTYMNCSKYGEDFVYVVPESGERKRMQVESLRDCCVNGIGIVGFREWREIAI